MKLYVGILSLFSAKARIALGEKGLSPELVYVGWSRQDRYLPHHPEVAALNPKAQVPVLVDGEVVVCDSTRILEYLEDRTPDPPLYPADVVARARCRELEAAGDEIWFPCVWELIEARFYGDGPDTVGASSRLEGVQASLQSLYDGLEKDLAGREYLLGRFSAADISTFIQVQAARSLGAPASVAHTAVHAWIDRVSGRASVAPVVADMAQAAARALAKGPADPLRSTRGLLDPGPKSDSVD